LSISNLAWDVAEDEAVAALLGRVGVDAIDIAPGKYFPRIQETTDSEIERVRRWWNERGVEITGMQALLFGTAGLNLFGPVEVQDAMLRHLTAVCRIGAGLGARCLVFGSPKNRDRLQLSPEDALPIAVSFFRRLGDIARAHRVTICLEPNPARYGANFMTDSAETAAVVTAVDHPSIRMQLDVGALAVNRENARAVVQQHAALIAHVHASEPDLVPVGDGTADHACAAAAIAQALPDRVIAVEMLSGDAAPHLETIERALRLAIRHYRAPAAPELAP
jgi:sugar phosphate isomerase/epimerase